MLALLLVPSATAQDATCPQGVAWPGASWPVAQVSNVGALVALDAFLFPPGLSRDTKKREGVRTDGVVVVHNGAVVYERYGGGYDASTRHLTWSVTKSFTNNLVGIAVGQGRLSLGDSICEHVDVGNRGACDITVEHLLTFSSGLDWAETYEDESPRTSAVLSMLYGEGKWDMASFVSGHALRDAPGSSFSYSSGDTVLLSAVVGATLGSEYGQRFPFVTLLDRIGMTSARFERDNAGTYVGSSYLYATPRDMARAGLFWLHDGCWDGERLLPEGWLSQSTAVSEPFRRNPLDAPEDGVQGWQFWLNRTVPEQGLTRLPWGDVAGEGAYAARGHWGQSITVLPQHGLVVVRTADDRESGVFDFERFLDLAVGLVEER